MNNDVQRRSNSSGRMYQDYQATVVAVEHPKGLHMAKVRLLGLWDTLSDDVLPWAEFLLPLGAKPSAGQHVPVEVGDLVWVDFPRNGDTRYPRIVGSCYHAPEFVSHLPAGQPGKGHADEPPAPELSLKDDVYSRFGICEYKTHQGHWGVVHVPTGTRIEINAEGIVIHSEGDSFRSSGGNMTENVGGDCKIKITGNADFEAAAIKFKSAGAFEVDAGGPFNVKATLAAFKLG